MELSTFAVGGRDHTPRLPPRAQPKLRKDRAGPATPPAGCRYRTGCRVPSPGSGVGADFGHVLPSEAVLDRGTVMLDSLACSVHSWKTDVQGSWSPLGTEQAQAGVLTGPGPRPCHPPPLGGWELSEQLASPAGSRCPAATSVRRFGAAGHLHGGVWVPALGCGTSALLGSRGTQCWVWGGTSEKPAGSDLLAVGHAACFFLVYPLGAVRAPGAAAAGSATKQPAAPHPRTSDLRRWARHTEPGTPSPDGAARRRTRQAPAPRGAGRLCLGPPRREPTRPSV